MDVWVMKRIKLLLSICLTIVACSLFTMNVYALDSVPSSSSSDLDLTYTSVAVSPTYSIVIEFTDMSFTFNPTDLHWDATNHYYDYTVSPIYGIDGGQFAVINNSDTRVNMTITYNGTVAGSNLYGYSVQTAGMKSKNDVLPDTDISTPTLTKTTNGVFDTQQLDYYRIDKNTGAKIVDGYNKYIYSMLLRYIQFNDFSESYNDSIGTFTLSFTAVTP